LDVPLADVHELLVAEEMRAAVLLERLLGAQELLPYEVVERDESARELIGLRGACEAEALERAAPALIADLVETVPGPGNAAARRSWGSIHSSWKARSSSSSESRKHVRGTLDAAWRKHARGTLEAARNMSGSARPASR
jgi:hypothetical protein